MQPSGSPPRRETTAARAAAAVIALGINALALWGMVALGRSVGAVVPPTEPVRAAVRFDAAPPPPPTPPRVRRSRTAPAGAAPPTFEAPRLPSQVQAPPPAAATTGPAPWSDGALDVDLSAGASLVFQEEAVHEPARLVEKARPRYPALALQRRISGTVQVRATVGPDGIVREVTVVDADPPGIFERSAIEAVRQYRFAPARVAGRAVPVVVRQQLRYELR